MSWVAGLRGVLSRHGRLFGEIAVVSGIGVVATAGFQLVAIRGLGSEDFGVLAALLALLNLVSVGSAALRNSAAVTTAVSETRVGSAPPRRRVDATLLEATALGGAGTIAVGIVALALAEAVGAGSVAVALIAATALPYFFFARAQGRLQGTGRARSVVWWSTGAQVVQFLLVLLVVVTGQGVDAVLLVLVVVAVAGAVGATYQARNAPASHAVAFSRSSSIVLLTTIAFTWITGADVVLVKAGADPDTAGAYAAAAVLVKATLIIPATLSLYLLPRLAASRGDTRSARAGMTAPLLVTAAGALLMAAVVTVFGEPITALLFGADYRASSDLLPWLAVSWVPWALAQAALIRALALASLPALLGLASATIVQWWAVSLALPDIYLAMTVNGAVGAATLAVLLAVHAGDVRRSRAGDGSAV